MINHVMNKTTLTSSLKYLPNAAGYLVFQSNWQITELENAWQSKCNITEHIMQINCY